MNPWKWVYWRVAHILGWHYVGSDVNRRKCHFCAWRRKPLTRAQWEDLFDKHDAGGI